MTKTEEFAYKYLRASQHPDSRVLRDYVKGRSVSWREMVYRQLKRWDCHRDVPISLLNVEPKQTGDLEQ